MYFPNKPSIHFIPFQFISNIYECIKQTMKCSTLYWTIQYLISCHWSITSESCKHFYITFFLIIGNHSFFIFISNRESFKPKVIFYIMYMIYKSIHIIYSFIFQMPFCFWFQAFPYFFTSVFIIWTIKSRKYKSILC